MYYYGAASKAVLATCHPDIRVVMNEAIKYMDLKPYEGIRSKETQAKYFAEGKSKLDGFIKKSKHQGREVPPEVYEDDKGAGDYTYNQAGEPIISYALDVAPYPIDWNDKARFYMMGGLIRGLSERLYAEKKISHVVRWGGDWDGDGKFTDQTFHDLPHIELITV